MDIVCFSHLRWNFVYQRPQHLLSRFARQFRVFFIEEPVFDSNKAYLATSRSSEGVWVIVPHLPEGLDEMAIHEYQEDMLQDFFRYSSIDKYIFWYYTPMALSVSRSFTPELIIYDCMDELSAFKNAPASLKQNEAELMSRADIVFTGGQSLYEAKKDLHPNIHAFPSSIDKKHFEKARSLDKDPPDQLPIPYPRIGFFGVIDERMDIVLLEEAARKKPNWNFILIGPVVKIDPATLPKYPNIFYLGGKDYNELPSYLAGWDVAMMPFALNESTRFISPTKTPEYLAGGKPVVSTAIRDVVNPYGENGLVYIAQDADDFIRGIESEMNMRDPRVWLKMTDAFLAKNSWDITAEKMIFHINTILEKKQSDTLTQKDETYV
jgi:glycosyltransferase involved in cell wall biosynthesis